MDAFAGWINGAASPANTTTMAINAIFVGNNNLLQISNALINLPVTIQNPALTPNLCRFLDFLANNETRRYN